MSNETLTAHEAADYLKLHYVTLLQKVDQFGGRKTGRRYVFLKSNLDYWLTHGHIPGRTQE